MIYYGIKGVYFLIGVAVTLFVFCIALAVMSFVLERWREEAEREEKARKERENKRNGR